MESETRAEKYCVFCKKNSNQKHLGSWYNFEKLDFHGNCLVFCSGLYQTNNDKTSAKNFRGFFLSDINRIIKQRKLQKCALCREMGATIRCCVEGCKCFLHLPCALEENKTLHLYFDEFVSFCPVHTPECLFDNKLITGVEKREAMKPNCCGKFSYHFECIKKYLLEAGKSAECPNCHSKKKFLEFMKSCGIVIPEK